MTVLWLDYPVSFALSSLVDLRVFFPGKMQAPLYLPGMQDPRHLRSNTQQTVLIARSTAQGDWVPLHPFFILPSPSIAEWEGSSIFSELKVLKIPNPPWRTNIGPSSERQEQGFLCILEQCCTTHRCHFYIIYRDAGTSVPSKQKV